MEPQTQYLQETHFFDYSHSAVRALLAKVKSQSPIEQALELYYLIRDSIRYNPYTFADGAKAFHASYAAGNDQAYCIPKSSLMVAACRALGIPARLGLADVKNHLSSPRLIELLGTDLFVMHGYADVYLNEKWVKCTPVFNRELCAKMNVTLLEFDGMNDSIFHPYTDDGKPHMEYVKDHGTFAELPEAFILDSVAQAYPGVKMLKVDTSKHSLEQDMLALNN